MRDPFAGRHAQPKPSIARRITGWAAFTAATALVATAAMLATAQPSPAPDPTPTPTLITQIGQGLHPATLKADITPADADALHWAHVQHACHYDQTHTGRGVGVYPVPSRIRYELGIAARVRAVMCVGWDITYVVAFPPAGSEDWTADAWSS
jgi:hypothetical protein